MLKPHIKQIKPGVWVCFLPYLFHFGLCQKPEWHYLNIVQYGETPAEALHAWKAAKTHGEEAVREQCNKVAESYKLSHGAPFIVSPAPALPEVENPFVPNLIITAWRRLFCKHDWKHLRSIHGDERNYATDEWGCPKCGKHRYSGGIYG